MIKCSVVCALLMGSTCLKADFPEPYASIELLPFDPQGWYNNSAGMERLFSVYQPHVVIEVGCWLGASTRHMASLLPQKGVLYAVDHWQGSVEHQPGQPFWLPVLSCLYTQFLSNIVHAHLTHKVIPVRMSSQDASRYLEPVRADLVYIDASHDYQSVYADLCAWYPLVKGRGVMCGDDWGYPDICLAVQQFAGEQGLTVHGDGMLWYLTE